MAEQRKGTAAVRILVVEDEKRLSEALVHILKKKNYTVDAVYDGEDGLDYIMSGIYDVVVLDNMLPKMNGIEILKQIRHDGIDVPVIMLTALGEISDKVKGLDSGADDYLAKPFDTEELLARIRALGRRKGEIVAEDRLSFGDISLDASNLKLFYSGGEMELTLKEAQLLEHLILHKNMVSSKEQIIEKLWGFESEAEANHVEVYIHFLRNKLAAASKNVVISTVRGVGYTLKIKE